MYFERDIQAEVVVFRCLCQQNCVITLFITNDIKANPRNSYNNSHR